MRAAKNGGVASLFMGQCHFIRGSDAFCKSAAEEGVCLKQNSLANCLANLKNTCGPGYKKCLASDPSGDKTFGDSIDAIQLAKLQGCNPTCCKGCKIHTGCFCDGDWPNADGYGLADDCNCDLSKGKVYGCVDWTQGGDGNICSATGSDSKIGGTRLDITLNILATIYGRLLDLAIGLTVFRYSIYRKSVTPELVDDEGLCPPFCCARVLNLGPGAQRIIILIWVAISVPVVCRGDTCTPFRANN